MRLSKSERRIAVFIARFMLLLAGAVGGVALLLGLAIFLLRDHTLDEFEVVAVIAEPRGSRFAVVARYLHANSSTGWMAVWIAAAAPAIGSDEHLDGSPAAVWRGDESQIWWSPTGRIELAVPFPVADTLSDCYFGDDHACIDAERVDIAAP